MLHGVGKSLAYKLLDTLVPLSLSHRLFNNTNPIQFILYLLFSPPPSATINYVQQLSKTAFPFERSLRRSRYYFGYSVARQLSRPTTVHLPTTGLCQ